jgi:hypothetical protein
METLIIHPEGEDKAKALKGFLKAFNIRFESYIDEKQNPYNPEFIAKIERGNDDVRTGHTTKISLDEIWK